MSGQKNTSQLFTGLRILRVFNKISVTSWLSVLFKEETGLHGVRAKTDCHRIRIMCPSGAICLPTDWTFVSVN
jgi:hypothetical protein